jgi:hypothetical protein
MQRNVSRLDPFGTGESSHGLRIFARQGPRNQAIRRLAKVRPKPVPDSVSDTLPYLGQQSKRFLGEKRATTKML